jgi:hypothetical protein
MILSYMANFLFDHPSPPLTSSTELRLGGSEVAVHVSFLYCPHLHKEGVAHIQTKNKFHLELLRPHPCHLVLRPPLVRPASLPLVELPLHLVTPIVGSGSYLFSLFRLRRPNYGREWNVFRSFWYLFLLI